MHFIDKLPRIMFESGTFCLCAVCKRIFTQINRSMRKNGRFAATKPYTAEIIQIYALEDADWDS